MPNKLIHSTYVQFSWQVFIAYHTHNYIQFFSLLKSASYLQACLMYKLINSVRAKALQVIAKAFQHYRLQTLTELLLFANEQECIQFIQLHQLKLQNRLIIMKGFQVVDHQLYQAPNMTRFMKKKLKNKSLSQIVTEGHALQLISPVKNLVAEKSNCSRKKSSSSLSF